MTGCIDELIKRTGLKMRKVDILVVNCSLFSPTPSLCAMIANHYRVWSVCRPLSGVRVLPAHGFCVLVRYVRKPLQGACVGSYVVCE